MTLTFTANIEKLFHKYLDISLHSQATILNIFELLLGITVGKE